MEAPTGRPVRRAAQDAASLIAVRGLLRHEPRRKHATEADEEEDMESAISVSLEQGSASIDDTPSSTTIANLFADSPPPLSVVCRPFFPPLPASSLSHTGFRGFAHSV